jgi:hypothetical protein
MLAFEATNAKLSDGTRGMAWRRLMGWRRPATGPLKWIWGQVEITDDDVTFRDWAEQPSYMPDPLLDNQFQLERELANCQSFIDALQDDEFAIIAYDYLTWLDWVKIDTSDALGMNGSGSTGSMIAGLRAKGEDYMDYRWNEVVIPEAQQIRNKQRLFNILQQMGWRPRDHE